MVGMRRANQLDLTSNGQHRVVGDHLGSTTLVVDTSSPPQVVHRQYYKPYGEVAYSAGSSRTTIGYTGQRLDTESGLMYYGARYYDPVLSYFVSADGIIPGAENTTLTVNFNELELLQQLQEENRLILEKGFWFQRSEKDKQETNPSGPRNPQALNRYSYVLNNPLRYTDPTGHYYYRATYLIGYTSEGVTQESVMRAIQSNPQKYFRFNVRPVSGCPSSFKKGCSYELSSLIVPDLRDVGPSPYLVEVTSLTSTSFTFTVRTAGGFAPPGSTVSFRTYEENGGVYLEVIGSTPMPKSWEEYFAQQAEQTAAWFTWFEMAKRLRRDLVGEWAFPYSLPCERYVDISTPR